MRNLLIVFAIISVILVSGCTTTTQTDTVSTTQATDPQARCVELCRGQIAAGIDMSMGPCLSETPELSWEIEDWVCDVAHLPRKDIDDNSINQCQEYRKEEAAHFVEVTPNCEFIRKL